MILSCVFLKSQSHVNDKRASKGFLTQPLVSAHLLSLASTWSSPSFSLSWYSSRAFENHEWSLLMVRHSPVCTSGTGESDQHSRWDGPRCWRPLLPSERVACRLSGSGGRCDWSWRRWRGRAGRSPARRWGSKWSQRSYRRSSSGPCRRICWGGRWENMLK